MYMYKYAHRGPAAVPPPIPYLKSGTGTACCWGGRCVGGRPCPLDASYAPSGAAVRCTTKCSLRKDAVSP